MAGKSNLPDELRTRVLKQRKRQRIVRFSFALTAVAVVILLFGFNHLQTLAPTSRVVYALPAAETLWLIDQHIDVSSPTLSRGSFALMRHDGESVTSGARFDGLVSGAVLLPGNRLGVTTGERFLTFDLSAPDFARDQITNLGIDDPEAGVLVLSCAGRLWLIWTRGPEVNVRPLDDLNVAPHSLHKVSGTGARLGGTVAGDRVWLSVRDTRSNEVTLVCFKPGIEQVSAPPSEAPVPADAEPPARRTRIEVLERTKATGNVRASSLAVLETEKGDLPLLAFIRKEEKQWGLLAYDTAEKSWREGTLPQRSKPPTGMELSNFVTLARDGSDVLCVFNDGREVKLARGRGGHAGIEFEEPSLIPLDRPQGITGYIVSLVVLVVLFLLMASQGVWMLLNRDRPGDRTLAAMLEKKVETDTQTIKKPEMKLPYAGHLARALALLIDLAVTSPLVILLKDVYDYSFEQAYGFLAVGTMTGLDGSMLVTLKATAVTLMLLAIYGAFCELMWGKTLGKALLRLRVVDRKGEAAASWRIVVRNVLKVFELIHFLVLLIPMVLMMMSGKQQRLGDMLAGTYVIVEAVPEESPDDIDI